MYLYLTYLNTIWTQSQGRYYQPSDVFIVMYKLCKSYVIPHNKHNLHWLTPYFKIFVIVA